MLTETSVYCPRIGFAMSRVWEHPNKDKLVYVPFRQIVGVLRDSLRSAGLGHAELRFVRRRKSRALSIDALLGLDQEMDEFAVPKGTRIQDSPYWKVYNSLSNRLMRAKVSAKSGRAPKTPIEVLETQRNAVMQAWREGRFPDHDIVKWEHATRSRCLLDRHYRPRDPEPECLRSDFGNFWYSGEPSTFDGSAARYRRESRNGFAYKD